MRLPGNKMGNQVLYTSVHLLETIENNSVSFCPHLIYFISNSFVERNKSLNMWKDFRKTSEKWKPTVAVYEVFFIKAEEQLVWTVKRDEEEIEMILIFLRALNGTWHGYSV